METVYIVAIVAIAIVIVALVWMLRDRITTGRFGASVSEKTVEAEFQAASPPEKAPEPPPPTEAKSPDVDISGNWMIGTNVVRVLRDGVRVASNRLLGKQRIEVKPEPPKLASKPKKQKKK